MAQTEMVQVAEQNVSGAIAGTGVTGMPAVDQNLSFKNEDFKADMAKLSANASGQPETTVPIPPPTTPAQPSPAAVTPEAIKVPEKFLTPDGQIDKAKLEKSTLAAEEALLKYLEKEKELKRKINEVKAQENAYVNPPPAISAPAVIPINIPFAQQLENDIAKDGAGVVLSKLFIAAQEAAEDKIRGELNGLKAVNSENATKRQVEDIGKKDPWVFTEEGIATLTRVLDSQPYLWQAADPYKAAYLIYQGTQSIASKFGSQVLTPTPMTRPTAPVPSGQAANQTISPTVKLDNREAIDKHLKGLSVEQQSEFFKKLGYPAFR